MNLDFYCIESVTDHLNGPENYDYNTNISHILYFIFLPFYLMSAGSEMDLNRIESVTIHLSDSENDGFRHTLMLVEFNYI